MSTEQPQINIPRAIKRHLDESVRQAIRTKANSPHVSGNFIRFIK